MTTAGIVESKCALIMAVVAIAEVCGKACLSIFGDHLPFPKVYLFVLSSVVGSGIMYGLTVAKTVPAMMCVAVGKKCYISLLSKGTQNVFGHD